MTPADLIGPDPKGLRALTLHAMACSRRDDHLKAVQAAGPQLASEWLDFAEKNDVGPIVAHTLLEVWESGFPAADRAEELFSASDRRMRTMMAELDLVAERLSREGIAMLALKNAGIARGIFPIPGLCPMGDLDVLIDRARFREAHALVEECGFKLDSRAEIEEAEVEAGLHSGGTEYIKQVAGEEVWFELQWRPIAGRWIRADQEPTAEELIERSVPIPDSCVRLLSPVDNMLQVSLHTAKHTYVRAPGLRLHTDVDRLTRYATPDWSAYVAQAREKRVCTAVYYSLFLATALLQTDVPGWVLAELRPPAWKEATMLRWLRRVDLFYPDDHKFSRPAMMVFAALMYDDVPGLMASALDTDPENLGLRHLPGNLRQGFHRMRDITTRYQR